jgi:hypothetical protein
MRLYNVSKLPLTLADSWPWLQKPTD